MTSSHSAPRVLMVHNRYQHAGGEDAVFAAEVALLRSHGHAVVEYVEDNATISSRVAAAVSATWSKRSARAIASVIRSEGIEVMHCHNIFPLISPSAYYAAASCRIPVVQTLHNYRVLCPGATCLRDNAPCTRCVRSLFPIAAIRYSCYRNSRSGSAAVAIMLGAHNALKTWTRKVDAYIALSNFGRDLFIEGGLPRSKLWVKPNFLESDPGIGKGKGGYALFVGRLSPEKGIEVALTAWADDGCRLPLKVIGDGPLRSLVETAAAENPQIEYLGLQPRETVLQLMKEAVCLIFPSLWFEGLPMTIIEAFACGTPVIASKLGTMVELVEHGHNGHHFTFGSAHELRQLVRSYLSEPERLPDLRLNARNSFLSEFSKHKNYEMLNEIYTSVIQRKRLDGRKKGLHTSQGGHHGTEPAASGTVTASFSSYNGSRLDGNE